MEREKEKRKLNKKKRRIETKWRKGKEIKRVSIAEREKGEIEIQNGF